MLQRFLSLLVINALFVAACATPDGGVRTTSSPVVPRSAGAADTARSGPGSYLPPWNFMSLSTAGVDTFLQEHPTYDGRGVVVLVFDTGVDPSIPGLQRTSTGAQKVIDVVDFSRSNVVRFTPATVQGAGALQTLSATGHPGRIRDVHMLQPTPVDGRWYLGAISEAAYRNATVRDFDGDGSARSVFAVVVYRGPSGWRVAVDTDADSSMANEQSVGVFAETFETFGFRQATAGERSPLTFAVSRIDTTLREVSFHYDMNVHGTHVAGIATGFGINREPGFNGVAPGAQVISGKFSSDWAKDITTTGSMRNAYLYAARLADSLAKDHTPVVVNMSFGIGSAIEGEADIERFLDELLPKHPNLYVLTSAGNEGPGLSSVGIPAAASEVITVGALLPRGIGRDAYNSALGDDVLWDFSSRGGEVDKPDIVAPGTAVSTITRFSFESRLSGTSMASPYAAGVVALLLSAMRQEDSTWIPSQELVRRALRASATVLPYYTALEQGAGVINVRRAYEMLRQYRRSGFADAIERYRITTHSPMMPERSGRTAYWRSAYVPDNEWRQEFSISRLASSTNDFFRAFELESTAPWLGSVQKTVYIRGTGSAQVDAVYDRTKMTEPGLYTGRIVARRATSAGPAARAEVEFELVNTVIVPYLLDASKGFTVTTPSFRLPAGHTKRFYVAPPAGIAGLTFTLDVPKGSASAVSGELFDHDGRSAGYLPRVVGRERTSASTTISSEDLGEGIVEIVVEGDGTNGSGAISEATLTIAAVMAEFDIDATWTGHTADIEVAARSTGVATVYGNTSVTQKGYIRTVRDTLRADTFSMPVTMRRQDGALWIAVAFEPRDYNRSTDILVRLIDEDGAVQADEAYGAPQEWVFLPNFDREADSTVFRLEIIFGFAADRDLPRLPITIIEKHVRPGEPTVVDGWSGTELVPYLPQKLRGRMPVTDVPVGYDALGELTFKPRGEDTGLTWEFVIDRE